jgi:hypothetical protein
MSFFREGDEVVLRPRQDGWEFEPPLCYTDEMVEECECGEIFRVGGDVNGGSYFTIYGGSFMWSVLPEWVEFYNFDMENE